VTAAGRARLDEQAWGVPYVLAMSVAAFVVSYGLYVAVRPGDGLAHSDVPHYNAYAVHVAARQLPYRDFQLEYPPAAVVAFVLPAADLPGVASTDGAAWDPPNAAAVWDALRVQFRGGLHIETAASAVLVLASRASAELSSLGLFDSFTLSDREAEHGLGRGVLVGPGTGAAVTILNVLLVAGVLGLLASLARSKGDVREQLVRYSAAVVATTVALGSVLSPQYLVWLLPLVVLVGGRRGTAATVLFVLASVLTQVWFRWIYTSYARDLDAGTATVLLARNLLLLAIALVLALPAKSLLASSNRP